MNIIKYNQRSIELRIRVNVIDADVLKKFELQNNRKAELQMLNWVIE